MKKTLHISLVRLSYPKFGIPLIYFIDYEDGTWGYQWLDGESFTYTEIQTQYKQQGWYKEYIPVENKLIDILYGIEQ